MKIAVIGKIKKNREILKTTISKCGYKVTEKDPDYVIALGGDGSLLMSECIYPSIPKLHIIHRTKWNGKDDKNIKRVMEKIAKKEFRIIRHPKLEASIKRENTIIKRIAANDISIRNEEPWHALRFNLKINNKNKGDFIGDGIVASTPFGSTGYFYSITKKKFKSGIGLAFNNPTTKIKPIIKKDQVIKLTVTRNKAIISSDNNMNTVTIKEGDSVVIKQGKDKFNLIKV
jgi:NAD+ kinase